MIVLHADNTMMLKNLGLFVEPVEVRDDACKLLGVFVPANLERGEKLYADGAAKIDRAEIERRKAAGERRLTTVEVFEHLKTLTNSTEQLKDLDAHIKILKERHGCPTP
jgi:hypothetical protein